MNQYMFSYYGEPHFTNPEEGKAHMDKWRAWVQGLGAASVDRGLAVQAGSMVSKDGITEANGKGRFTGYSVVQAEDLDAAVALTQGCPHLDHEGCAIGVHEVHDVPM